MAELPSYIAQAASERIRAAEAAIENTLAQVRQNNPLAAELNEERLVNGIASRMKVSHGLASSMAREIRTCAVHGEAFLPAPGMPLPQPSPGAMPMRAGGEAVQGSGREFVGVAFLQRGINAAKAVARIAFRDGRPHGTGFLISDRLLLTNHHVIKTAAAASSLVAEFDYEFDINGQSVAPTRFGLDPDAFFLPQDVDDLDYTIVALGPRIEGGRTLAEFGWIGLSASPHKHMLGEVANIVQHPDGRRKEIVVRENLLVARLKTVLHYLADTEPGSSGSPVFNNDWEVIALHHWGSPWRETTDAFGRPLSLDVNEGIRISAIVHDVRKRMRALEPAKRRMIETAIEWGESASGVNPSASPTAVDPGTAGSAARVDVDGRVTWSFPVEVSVRIPHLGLAGCQPAMADPAAPVSGPTAVLGTVHEGGGEQLEPDYDFSDRKGYNPRFLGRLELPLPKLGSQIERLAAPNLEAEEGEDPHELKYHHFSIVMNGARRLAFFTACNIDGAKAKKLDRDTGQLGAYPPRDFTIDRGSEAAEASELWFADTRLSAEHYTDPDTQYAGQRVPGYGSRDRGRMPRMLQRGHLVRRMDPVWGSDRTAVKAEADTFFTTNCAPQFGAFNMGTGKSIDVDGQGTGGGMLWRLLEDHVLGNAVVHKMKVTCFTGPIFKRNDPPWRGIRIPLRFWKICVWMEDGELRSLAMIADQKPVLDALAGLPESAAEAESLHATRLVADFLSTVEEVESETKLDFGLEIRQADIRGGLESESITSFDEIALFKEHDSGVSEPEARALAQPRLRKTAHKGTE